MITGFLSPPMPVVQTRCGRRIRRLSSYGEMPLQRACSSSWLQLKLAIRKHYRCRNSWLASIPLIGQCNPELSDFSAVLSPERCT